MTENIIYRFSEKFTLRKKLPEPEAKQIVRQLCDAIEYLHSHQVHSARIELKVKKIFNSNYISLSSMHKT